MRDCIYREFDISSRPTTIERPLANAKPVEGVIITLTHKLTGATKTFTLNRVLSGHDQVIEAQILLLFPDSESAKMIRRVLGHESYVLKPRWQVGFAASIQYALLGLCDSKGANFWWNLMPTLPAPVLLMLYKRAAQHLMNVVSPQPLRVYALALRQGWMEVLSEGCTVDGWRDVNFTRLYKRGWPIESLEKMSHAELGGIAERCRLALLAIDFLEESDWFGMLGFLIEDARLPSEVSAK